MNTQVRLSYEVRTAVGTHVGPLTWSGYGLESSVMVGIWASWRPQFLTKIPHGARATQRTVMVVRYGSHDFRGFFTIQLCFNFSGPINSFLTADTS